MLRAPAELDWGTLPAPEWAGWPAGCNPGWSTRLKTSGKGPVDFFPALDSVEYDGRIVQDFNPKRVSTLLLNM